MLMNYGCEPGTMGFKCQLAGPASRFYQAHIEAVTGWHHRCVAIRVRFVGRVGAQLNLKQLDRDDAQNRADDSQEDKQDGDKHPARCRLATPHLYMGDASVPQYACGTASIT